MERNIDIGDIENTLDDIREHLESVTLRDLAALAVYATTVNHESSSHEIYAEIAERCYKAADAFIEAREGK